VKLHFVKRKRDDASEQLSLVSTCYNRRPP
jgi:hypothetical protein